MSLLSLLMFVGWAHADVLAQGGHVGGGDAIFCMKTPSEVEPRFDVDGFYALDYALTLPGYRPVAPVATLKESIERIRAALVKNYPQSLVSFDDFFASVNLDIDSKFQFLIDTDTRKWIPVMGNLERIPDVFVRYVPVNCRVKHHEGEMGFWDQAVVRRYDGKITYYRYDVGIMARFRSQQPLQASFLLIHEWLWDHYQHMTVASPRIRNANQFLHSIIADKVNAEVFHQLVFKAEPGP